ncbi:nucleotidyl transferase AbiEii/AbiGii toxin family protein [Curtanaerobium respiraculi]|uniref:nucleotidyl transferase AbiEii/AbiGii toxin family protein n=1 Tax=Curtanaerobium respiraculi TaxID=2949669 RepID=UPI0024B31FA4|nr:nucleotidyl transferase AbiEii/AbiGii toxin family protein [Curtanaerobium respiraculi]
MVIPREPAHPKDVPEEYVMQPFDVKLSYLGKPWCTVPLEVGFNEIGDADEADWIEPDDVSGIFDSVGLPAPGPAPLMMPAYQVAQKLHAVTGGDRPRDLVDLQVMMANGDIDLVFTRSVCVRLFAYRKRQEWPPKLVKREGWDEAYAMDSEGLSVLASADDAVAWANDLIARIDASK